VAQNAINYNWLIPGQMIDGLALGETTPGPLIKIVAFVGFIGAWQATDFGVWGAVLGAFVATYFTFLPSFLFILLGAPVIEASRGMPQLSSALSGITSAVVGVIFNLAVFFGSQVFLPKSGGIDFAAVLIAVAAFIGMWQWKWNIIYVVFGAGLVGMCYRLIA
jgi:chromate transporter